jgi:hypothetical protein
VCCQSVIILYIYSSINVADLGPVTGIKDWNICKYISYPDGIKFYAVTDSGAWKKCIIVKEILNHIDILTNRSLTKINIADVIYKIKWTKLNDENELHVIR